MILNETRELLDNTNKRYDDTDILIREFLEHEPESKRAMVSLERMNFIHSHYQISNRDYLYVLAVFIVEPIVWIRKYGWRNPHPKEELAAYLRWKHVGEKKYKDVEKLIKDSVIVHHHNIHIAHEMGIKSVPESFEDVEKMMESYEEKYMKYAESNKELSESTMKLLLSKIPFKCLHATFLHPIIAALCPDRLRLAMGMREPSNALQKLAPFALYMHSFINKHFVPPRSSPILRCSESDSEYVPVEPDAQKMHTAMLYTNFDEYEATYKNGYRIEELGPHHLSEKRWCPMMK